MPVASQGTFGMSRKICGNKKSAQVAVEPAGVVRLWPWPMLAPVWRADAVTPESAL